MLVAAAPAVLGGSVPPVWFAVQFLAVGCLGSFAVQAMLAPTQYQRTYGFYSGVACEALRVAVIVALRLPVSLLISSTGLGLGAGALACAWGASVVDPGPKALRARRVGQLALLGPISAITLAFAAVSLGRNPTAGPLGGSAAVTYDAVLYAFDGTLGSPLGVPLVGWVGRATAAFAVMHVVCGLVYSWLLVAVLMTLAGYARQYREGAPGVVADPVLAFAAMGVLATVCYVLYPAAGPAYAFGGAFPAHLPDPRTLGIAPAAVDIYAPRNCMPSVHTAWAILIWVTVRDLRNVPTPVRIAAATFSVITVLATLGLGEHYIVDLIVAAPFAVGVRALTLRASVGALRWRIATLQFAVVAAWIASLRSAVWFFRAFPVASWAAILLTLATAWYGLAPRAWSRRTALGKRSRLPSALSAWRAPV